MFVIRQQPSHFQPLYFAHPGSRRCHSNKQQQAKPKDSKADNDAPNTTGRHGTTDSAGQKPTQPMRFYRNPPAQVFEIDNSVFLTVDLPGIKAADIDVQIQTDTVRVTAQRRSNNGHAVVHYSKHFSINERNIDTADARASLVDGVLTVTLPKKEAEAPFNVPVESSSAPEAGKDGKDIRFDLELPGVKNSDLKIVVQDGDLVIEGERKSGSRSSVTRRVYGVNSKVVDPPTFQAYLKDGVLTVTAARKAPEAAKTISISTTTEESETTVAETTTDTSASDAETPVETVEEEEEEAAVDTAAEEESAKEWEQVLYEVDDEVDRTD